jgi:hypothetical protein
MIRRVILVLVMTAAGLSAISVNDAAAACSTSPGSTSAVLARSTPTAAANLPFTATSSPQLLKLDRDDKDDPGGIVGLWFTVFKIGDSLWNRGFQQYHAGNTELSVDSSVPPVLGNVCIGVWKAQGARTFKLRHVTWNWNPDGSPAGTFLLLTTVRLDRSGNSYSGTFESDSFDTANKVIPELHAEGTVTGRRITVD